MIAVRCKYLSGTKKETCLIHRSCIKHTVKYSRVSKELSFNHPTTLNGHCPTQN